MIVFLIGQLSRGGAEQQLYYVLRHLDEPATVISLAPDGYWETPIRELGHTVIALPRRSRFQVSRIWQIRRLLRQLNPDVVHLFLDSVSGFYVRLGALGFHPFVVSERSHPNYHPGWYRRLLPFLNRFVDAIICNSQAAREEMIRQKMAPPGKIHIIPNGLDLACFSPATRPHNPLTVGIVAHLTPVKNPARFVRIAARVHQEMPDVRFVMIGGGVLRDELLALINDLNLNGVVELLGERPDVPDLLQQMDVFVLTSNLEGTPNAVLEAMASGLPCVVTDVGDCRMLIEESGAGFVVPVDDEAGLADHVVKLLRDVEMRGEMQAKALEFVQAFSTEQLTKNHLAVYDRLRRITPLP
ncbi:MAG: glycosyltransferase [Chloroflexi bacterium]|nr:glycosyltransferase [Chloroflexota bacterium]